MERQELNQAMSSRDIGAGGMRTSAPVEPESFVEPRGERADAGQG
jgi:hypothetical protein